MWQWLVGGSADPSATEAERFKYKAEPLITLAKAKLRLPTGKWNEIQAAWRTMTGLEDVNAGGLPMNDPALLFLLGSIFCKASDNPVQQVDLLERIRRDRHDISWLSEHFDPASLEIAERMMKVFGCIFDLDEDGEILWPEFVSGVVILTHGTMEEKAEAVFRAIDTDGNMALSLDELQRFAESMLKGARGTLRESQDRFHISFSGRPVQPGEEYKGLLLSDVARILVEADINRDFQLSFNEYTSWVRKRVAQGQTSSPFIPEVVLQNEDGSRDILTSSMM